MWAAAARRRSARQTRSACRELAILLYPTSPAFPLCTISRRLSVLVGVGCRRVYVNVTKYAVTKDALGAIGIDAFLKDRVLVITATYDVIEGGWNLAACPEVVLTVVIPNVTSTTAGLGPLINVTLGYGVPRREPMWEPWLGKKMDHRGLIEFRSDPRLMLAGVHMTNHVPGGNITVSGVSTTHLAMQTVDGNLTVFGTDTSEIYMVAGSVHTLHFRELPASNG